MTHRKPSPAPLHCVGCKVAVPARAERLGPSGPPICAACKAALFEAIERAPVALVPLPPDSIRRH